VPNLRHVAVLADGVLPLEGAMGDILHERIANGANRAGPDSRPALGVLLRLRTVP